MSVQTILAQAGNKIGLNPAQVNERAVLLRFLNEAAYEIYNQADLSDELMEQVFKVNGNQTITLPADVGSIRAIREFESQIPWSLNQMRPRYNQFNWQDSWRNWRLKGRSALQTSVTNQSVVTVTIPNVDADPVIVTISGSTENATKISENVTMNATTKTTMNAFLDITSVTKNRVTDYDVTVLDVDENVLSVIANNTIAANYQVVDVSSCPWLAQSGSDKDHYLEVLYKKALPYLSNDGDEFPAVGYDYAIVNKMLQLWYQEQGQVEKALAYDQLVTRTLARKHEDENRATEDCVALVENPHDTIQPRIRTSRPLRYSGTGYGRFLR